MFFEKLGRLREVKVPTEEKYFLSFPISFERILMRDSTTLGCGLVGLNASLLVEETLWV